MRSTLTTAQYEGAHDTQRNRSRDKRAEIPRTPVLRASVSSSELPDPAEASQAHPATLEHTYGSVFALQPLPWDVPDSLPDSVPDSLPESLPPPPPPPPLVHRLLLHVQPINRQPSASRPTVSLPYSCSYAPLSRLFWYSGHTVRVAVGSG